MELRRDSGAVRELHAKRFSRAGIELSGDYGELHGIGNGRARLALYEYGYGERRRRSNCASHCFGAGDSANPDAITIDHQTAFDEHSDTEWYWIIHTDCQ
jgi:hypothetical protein